MSSRLPIGVATRYNVGPGSSGADFDKCSVAMAGRIAVSSCQLSACQPELVPLLRPLSRGTISGSVSIASGCSIRFADSLWLIADSFFQIDATRAEHLESNESIGLPAVPRAAR